MAERKTVTLPYKNTFSGSVAAGMGSLFSPNGRKYYILEHKVSSKYHKEGETQPIIVDNIELGRDSRCQVRFDEKFHTVSRHHAGIVRDGDMWKLVQISTKNSTLLNGHPIQTEWYLQNGDEIQLSVNGPKLGFIIPTGKKSTIASIGLTQRLSLFRQQALRPYKYAIATLSCILILAVSTLGLWNYYDYKEWNRRIAEVTEELDKQEKENSKRFSILTKSQAKTDSVMTVIENKNAELEKRIVNVKSSVSRVTGKINTISQQVSDIKTNIDKQNASSSSIAHCFKFVFFIQVEKIEVTQKDGSHSLYSPKDIGYGYVGTGFFLDDGRFVTAHHISHGWQFINIIKDENSKSYRVDDPKGFLLNKIANNGGKVLLHFGAYNCEGQSFSFTSDNFVVDKSSDEYGALEYTQEYVRLSNLDGSDWAYIYTNNKGNGLKFDNQLSKTLKRGTKLSVLGYPQGYTTENVQPLEGRGIVAKDGLDRGRIVTSETQFEQGNSGGPAIYVNENGEPIVVGLVSAGVGKTVGFLVPISNVRK